jgi:hypothetical protein
MASTMLADVIIPAVYMSYTAVDGPELTAFYESGVLVRNPALDQAFEKGGQLAHMPFWKDLDATAEPNYSTDDPADVAVPDKVVAAEMVCRAAYMNKGYQAADLVADLAGSNPMQRIRNRFARYWSRQYQRRIIKTCLGLYNENVANGASDMIADISIIDGAAVAQNNLFGRQAFTGAIFTLGDHFGAVVAIAVHSVVFKRMVDNDDITFIRPSVIDPNLPLSQQEIPTFLGKRVIIDDGMPAVATGTNNGYKFTSILFGEGALGVGERSPLTPVETFRAPYQGNGGGVEQLWERKEITIHPFGYKWLEASITGGKSPNWADMANVANWQRVIERKNVPIAFLVSNG